LIATAGLVTTAAGLILLSRLPSSVSFWELALPLAVVGAGMGTFAPPNRASVMSAVPPEDRGLAAGITTTLINFGNSVSRSLAFVILSLVIPAAALNGMFAGDYSSATFPANYLDGMHLVFLVSAGFVMLSIVPSILRGGRPARGEEKVASVEAADS